MKYNLYQLKEIDGAAFEKALNTAKAATSDAPAAIKDDPEWIAWTLEDWGWFFTADGSLVKGEK